MQLIIAYCLNLQHATIDVNDVLSPTGRIVQRFDGVCNRQKPRHYGNFHGISILHTVCISTYLPEFPAINSRGLDFLIVSSI